MKKLIASAAALSVFSAMLTGCGNKEDTSLDTAAPPPGSNAVAPQANPNKVLPGANSPAGSGTVQPK